MALRRSWLTLAVALGGFACGLSIAGTGTGPDGGPSGSIDGGPAPEGEPDPALDGAIGPDGSEPTAAGASGPVAIAAAGSVAAPTGNAQQTHLVHAENGGRWWLFTIGSDAPSELAAWSSTDFRTWTRGASLTLPLQHRGQGANFSVAYAALGARDVVHLGVGLKGSGNVRTHYHARAALDGAAITWTAPAGVSTVDDSLLGDPEGSATVITAGGRVIDFTGWAPYQGSAGSTGNQNAFSSQAIDDGTAWTSGFGPRIDIAPAARTVNARAALSLGGEAVLAVWESANDPEPDPLSLRSARTTTGGAWSSPIAVFSDGAFGVNDWGATALGAADVHAVRNRGSFEHRRYDGASWRAGDVVPPLPGGAKKNAGVVVQHDAARVAVATIAADGAVRLTLWSNGAWSAWSEVAPPGPARTALSGWWSRAGGLGLVWSEPDGAATTAAGLRVTP